MFMLCGVGGQREIVHGVRLDAPSSPPPGVSWGVQGVRISRLVGGKGSEAGVLSACDFEEWGLMAGPGPGGVLGEAFAGMCMCHLTGRRALLRRAARGSHDIMWRYVGAI